MPDNTSPPQGITNEQWQHIRDVSSDDFRTLVAAQEWKIIDIMYSKLQQCIDSGIECTQGHLDFCDLYNAALEYIDANDHKPPPWFVKLVRGE